MEIKKLTKKEQLALFSKKNRVELVREYVSYAKAFMRVAEYKVLKDILKYRQSSGMVAHEVKTGLACLGELTDEKEHEILKILSLEEAKTLYYSTHGILCPEALEKMMSGFSRKVSKEILMTYMKSCDLKEKTILKVLDIYTRKDAKEILTAAGVLSENIMCKMLQLYTKKEVKELVKTLIETDAPVEDDVQLEILETFYKKDAKELLEKAIEHDTYITSGMLEYIICCFSKKDAKELLTKYFEGCGKIYFESSYISDMMRRFS